MVNILYKLAGFFGQDQATLSADGTEIEYIESEKRGGERRTLYTQLPLRSSLYVLLFCHIIQIRLHTF